MRFWLHFDVIGVADVVAGGHAQAKQEHQKEAQNVIGDEKNTRHKRKMNANSKHVDWFAPINISQPRQRQTPNNNPNKKKCT